MPPRPRSSTLLSTSSTHSNTSTSSQQQQREFVASNPHQLISPSAGVAAFTSDGAGEGAGQGPKSWKSEHSLRTLRGVGGGGGSGGDYSSEAEGGEGDSGITLNGVNGVNHSSANGGTGSGLAGRRTGPQFVIDLDPSSSSSPYDYDYDASSPSLSSTTTGTRPRSSTFGGIELPPSPLPSSSSPAAYQPPTSFDSSTLPLPTTSPGPRPSLGGRGRTRSTSLSSLSSLRSLDPALHLGGAPLRERRPVLYAGLQAGGILLVSVVGLYLLLRGLLPPIEEEHKGDVKLPKSFEELKRLNEVLQVYRQRNNLRVMGCYVTVYLFLQAFSIPGSMYLSILGGALWGVVVALPLVCFCVASGALLCYLMSSALGPAVLLHSETWRKRVEAWERRVMEHRSNLVSYLIVLRIAPLPPHWVVNVLAPHLGITIWTFWISTFLGIAGVSYIHTQIGTTLDQMTSSEDFHLVSWGNALGLGGIILAVLIPVLLRRLFAADIASAASDPGGAEPSEPLLHPRVSLSLDDDQGGGERGTPRELLDGTARSATDGSARVVGVRSSYADEVGGGEAGGSGGGGSGRPMLKPGGGSADKVSRVLGVKVR